MKRKKKLAGILLIAVFVWMPAFADQDQDRAQTVQWGGQHGQHQQGMYGNEPGMWTERAGKMIDSYVKDAQGEEVGKVKDIIINREGWVQYLILAAGGVLGGSDKLIPIPFNKVRIGPRNETVTLKNIDQAKLKQAPYFTGNDWNQLIDPGFDNRVNAYYRGYESGQYQGGPYQGQNQGQQ